MVTAGQHLHPQNCRVMEWFVLEKNFKHSLVPIPCCEQGHHAWTSSIHASIHAPFHIFRTCGASRSHMRLVTRSQTHYERLQQHQETPLSFMPLAQGHPQSMLCCLAEGERTGLHTPGPVRMVNLTSRLWAKVYERRLQKKNTSQNALSMRLNKAATTWQL